jgi:hypothetical protein
VLTPTSSGTQWRLGERSRVGCPFAQVFGPPLLEFGRWDVSDGSKEATVVPPVDPFQGRELEVVDPGPRSEVLTSSVL